jgi:hypothetical protein
VTVSTGGGVLTPCAVESDGRRLCAVRQPGRSPRSLGEVTIVLNWFEELKAKAASVR